MSPTHRSAIAGLLLLISWRQSEALSMLGTFFVRRISRCSISVHRDSEVARSSVSKLLLSRLTIRARWKAGRLRGGPASTMNTTSIAASPLEGRTQNFHSQESQPAGATPPSPSTESSSTLARVVPAEEPWLSRAAERVRAGELVAFPTETVYGLGANALSEEAVLKIFKAKQRPLTDPLIVHIPDAMSALAVVDLEGEGGGGEKARRLLALLGEKLWPGPLTLILKAASGLPGCVTAGTGFVGVRCPAHPVTRQLLSLAGVPVAAPSANRFGHVSPTRAGHVMEDLGGNDILILDGDAKGACEVGIESTVAKIDVTNDRIVILRMGGVTQARLREVLAEGGEEFAMIGVHAGSVAGGKVLALEAKAKPDGKANVEAEKGQEDKAEGQAPGQLLRHYSPDLEVFRILVNSNDIDINIKSVVGARLTGVASGMGDVGDPVNLAEMARKSVVIDFGGRLKSLESMTLAYSDLSTQGDAGEAAEGLFGALRWAEGQPSAQRLLIAGLPGGGGGDLAAAVNDRIYRAASGNTISLNY